MISSSDDDVNNDQDASNIPYDGENANAYSNNEEIMMKLPPTNLQKMLL